MTQTITIPEGYMQDAKGRLVPQDMVKPGDLLIDQTVRAMHADAGKLSAEIARFKGKCFDDVASALDLLAEQYGDQRGGAKGNVTLTSHDGCLKVQVAVSDRFTFGPELQAAKNLIDRCIEAWSEGSRDEIRALVNSAFEVGQEGTINRSAVLGLRRHNIDDPTWKQAMEALTDSIRVIGSATYVRFYHRPNARAKWQAVPLDLASAETPASSSEGEAA